MSGNEEEMMQGDRALPLPLLSQQEGGIGSR